jgi:hypothetical protein
MKMPVEQNKEFSSAERGGKGDGKRGRRDGC